MLRAAYGLLRDSGRVFLEAAPKGLDPEQIGRALVAVPGVVHEGLLQVEPATGAGVQPEVEPRFIWSGNNAELQVRPMIT